MSSESQPFAYDAIAYPTKPQGQIHPERLAVVGGLFGLEPVPLERSRILELGCGDGRHLAPVAAAFPGSRCVGLDYSGAAVTRGRDFVERCGLRNVELKVADLGGPDPVEGEFDYIICHGLYAWVPEAVRKGILRVCRDHLSTEGLALVSYNALPGSCVRREVRNQLLWHTRHFADPTERLEEARALLQFLGGALLEGDEVRSAFRDEVRAAHAKDPGVLFHDELSEHYAPVYFHEFMAAAAEHGLRFVAESDPAEISLVGLPLETRNIIGALATDRVERQQYLDFVIGRRFRHTVLCRSERPVAEDWLIDRVERCWLASHGASVGTEKAGPRGPVVVFEHTNGLRLETDFVPGQEALRFLIAEAPRRHRFAAVLAHVRGRLSARLAGGGEAWDSADLPERLARFLLEACVPRVVTLHGANPEVTTTPGDRPVAFAVARVEAADGPFVTSAYHHAVRLEDRWGRELLRRADGTRTLAEIRSVLDDAAAVADRGEAELWRSIREDLAAAYGRFARLGLVVA